MLTSRRSLARAIAAGYHDYTAYAATNQQGVSVRAAAVYLPAAFLSGFRAGVARTFSYEIVTVTTPAHSRIIKVRPSVLIVKIGS
jgi:hypothetical protein